MKYTILFGARSYEHEISIVSAVVLKDILKERIQYFIFIDSKGDFYLIPQDKMNAKTFSTGGYEKYPKLQMTKGGFLQKSFLKEQFLGVEVMLNLIHGSEGEEGIISSLCEFYHIPYIGPRIEASVMSFSKELTKLYAQSRGVKMLPYHILDKQTRNIDSIPFEFPFIVKPLHLGSSIGIQIIRDKKEMNYNLDVAFEFDNKVLIEPFIGGIKEYNLAGCKVKKQGEEHWIFSMIEEPKKGELLDFNKKYLDFSRTEKTTQAEIDTKWTERMQMAFKALYHHCFEGALIRCDFFIHKDAIYLNEINPIPGSLAHYLFSDSFVSVLDALAQRLPIAHSPQVRYLFLSEIQYAKGK
ncbi:D-alanine--D-alanine ligase A [Helicobacter monodelphidis]|uniref:D-alanine--D-alanine ligase n=1 Tax=Helicobacter sp. 15-1451 TaxID=2004995 RepID=UPI000DCAEAA8|nr:D-alanine--D-alanine ligase [Helicobacter sp. 15-1451]RAX57677.1 D-alanine--D-alanine ligase A [Helicobacter sp. 15-1451]